jgi:hypothetical protein
MSRKPLGARVRAEREVPWLYLRSLLASVPQSGLFDEVGTFLIFVGYPRSSSTLVASLLNAHRNTVISHEVNALRLVRWRFSRRQIFASILERDRWFERRGRQWSGYEYAVPNQWQGRFERLLVIGDKRAAGTSMRLGSHPELLDRLRATVRVPLMVVHVLRNPFDNISTMAVRGGTTLDAAAATYFRMCDGVEVMRRSVNADEWLDVRHDDFVCDPAAELLKICKSLDIEADPDYLDDCSRVVWTGVKRTRLDQPWPDELVDYVNQQQKPYPWLKGYGFDS